MTAIGSSPAERPELTVVVVTHNNSAIIQKCLRSIMAAVRHHAYEIIVVDNNSNDGTPELAETAGAEARVIRLDQNVGFGAANNVGLDHAHGRFWALVNSDAFPDPGSLDVLLDALKGDAAAGIVGGRLRYASGEPQPSAGRFPSLGRDLWIALFLHRLPPASRLPVSLFCDPHLYRDRREADWVSGAFCVAKRDVGPLPDRAFLYGEDVDWCSRAKWLGYKVVVEPAAVATHIGGASVRANLVAGYRERRLVDYRLGQLAGRRYGTIASRAIFILHALVRVAASLVPPIARNSLLDERSRNLSLLRYAVSAHPSSSPSSSSGGLSGVSLGEPGSGRGARARSHRDEAQDG